jgi:hypothetical protein
MGRRALVVGGVVVLALAAAVVVAEVALRATAEERITRALRDELRAGAAAQVTIATDRPLLLQLAGGRLGRVSLTTDRLALDGTDVTDVRMDATDLTIRAPYTAAAMTAVGTVPTATVQRRLAAQGVDADVSVAGSYRGASGTTLGLPWGVDLVPRADEGRLTVDVVGADLAGVQVGPDALPPAVKDALTGLDVPVSGLPDGLTVTGAQVVPDGVRVTLTGHDVLLSGSY